MRLTLTPQPPSDVSIGEGRRETGAAREGHATRLNAAGGVGSQWRAPSPQVKLGAKSLKSLSVGGVTVPFLRALCPARVVSWAGAGVFHSSCLSLGASRALPHVTDALVMAYTSLVSPVQARGNCSRATGGAPKPRAPGVDATEPTDSASS